MAEPTVVQPTAFTWQPGPAPGIWAAPIRSDGQGAMVALVHYEAWARTGLHRHTEIGFAFLLAGNLWDYTGVARPGTLGVSLPGATHDTIAYTPTTFAAKLEGPVVTAGGTSASLYSQAQAEPLRNPAPERYPHRIADPDQIPALPTAVPGLARRVLDRYEDAGVAGRCCQVQLLPEAAIPPFRTADWVDLFVVGGDISVAGQSVQPGGFACLPPGFEGSISSGYGAYLCVWSKAPVTFASPQQVADPFGF